ncbi:MAG TPA: TonB-dependent receptor plug domain-containing protein [Niabella sp.]|nr:TonB-dependent receptor plug domain-containing protein [Niabella sp.]
MKKYCLPGWMYYCFLTFILSAVCVSVNAEMPDNTAVYANNNNSQRITVTGTVRDANGPLEGVNIIEKNGTGTSISKANGSYSISVADGNATLVFSAVGFEKQEVAVGGRTVINVEMKQSYTELSDVIVTALGITREKKSLGYSVAEVDGKEMNKVVQENILNSLSGKVPGVVINQTGGAGSSVSMVIRGASSLSNDNQPLFVIDGVPISNTLNNVSQVGTDNRVDFGNAISSLNPDDIASVLAPVTEWF